VANEAAIAISVAEVSMSSALQFAVEFVEHDA
jgi:hypothetical protein